MRTAEQAMSDYQFFKSRGICPQCGKEKAAPGRVCCLNCLDKQNIRRLERWDSMTEEQKEQVRSRVRQSGKALYVYLNDWTIYVVEDVSGAYVDKFHYEVNFLPEMIIPVTVTSHD